ncbi:hypothetical protein ADMFC3_12440 [Geovibrio sp. ADMFC3]
MKIICTEVSLACNNLIHPSDGQLFPGAGILTRLRSTCSAFPYIRQWQRKGAFVRLTVAGAAADFNRTSLIPDELFCYEEIDKSTQI